MIRSHTATSATALNAGSHCGEASTNPRNSETTAGLPRHATFPPGSSASAVRGSAALSARHRPTPVATM